MTTPDRIRPIHDEAAYQAALEAYEAFFDSEPEPGTEAGDAFALLGMVIARYEDEHVPIEAADPVSVVRQVMEGRGYSQADLAEVLGSAPRASELLSGKRPLSLGQIQKLHRAWAIPYDALLAELEAA